MLLNLTDTGSWIFDNIPRRAYVMVSEGDAFLEITSLRVIVPRVLFPNEDAVLTGIEGMLWTAVANRKEVPCVSPDQALTYLLEQTKTVRLCYKPGGSAEKVAKTYDLPCVLTNYRDQPEDILIGLPTEEALGFHLKDESGTDGLLLFPDQVAAIRIAEGKA